MEQLDGVRLRAWRDLEKEAEAEKVDAELYLEMKRECEEKYGDGPVTMGEDPVMLAMVVENEAVEFETI